MGRHCAKCNFQFSVFSDAEIGLSAQCRVKFAMRRCWCPLTPAFCHTQLAPRGTSHIILNVAHCPPSPLLSTTLLHTLDWTHCYRLQSAEPTSSWHPSIHTSHITQVYPSLPKHPSIHTSQITLRPGAAGNS